MYKSYELIMQQRQKTLAEIEEKKGQLDTLISLPQESGIGALRHRNRPY